MKIFEVRYEYYKTGKEVVEVVEFAAGDSIVQVASFFTAHYQSIDAHLRSVREVIIVTQDLRTKT